MEIRYYRREPGLFTLIVSTELYNQLTSDENVRDYVPWDRVAITAIRNADGNYNQDAINLMTQSVLTFQAYPLSGMTQTMQNFQFSFASNPERNIVCRARYYDSLAEIRVNTYGFVNETQCTTTNNDYPYGQFYGDYIADTIICSVLVCTDDFSNFKSARIIYAKGTIRYTWENANGHWAAFFDNVEPEYIPSPDPYEEAGGGEDPLPGSEIIGLPAEPTLTPIDAGLFSLYSPTAAQMRNLADFLWTDFGGTGTTVEQVLEEVVEALKRSVSNPLNSMLGLSIIASRGLSKGSDSSVHVGFWNTGVSMTKLTKQYFTVDCGSLTFSPVCGNTFLDYAPYSKFMIYLPYVGMRLLDANDVVGHTISVRYRGDCVSGALACYIIRDGSVIQEHTGNCALNIPLTADSWAETISGVAQLISGTVSGAAMGGSAAGAAVGAVRGAASVATNPSAFSPQVAHTGAVSGAAGHLGSQKPFILREAVRFHSTSGFNSIIGYPSYYYRKLGDCHGYTQCLEVHLSHTPCTGVELQEIEELLKKGVII